MMLKCTSDNRELILSILQEKIGERAVYHPLPEFAWCVGSYTLRRDGFIIRDDGSEMRSERRSADDVFETLTGLGLCERPFGPELEPPDMAPLTNRPDRWYEYDTGGCDAKVLINLMSMISARQRLLNSALGSRGSFYIAPELMADVKDRPPQTVSEFMQRIYGRDEEYRGIEFGRGYVALTGFVNGRAEERHAHMQLADRMMEAAREKKWVKSFTKNARNRKYAIRTWLNSIGMTGPEYEEARRVLLAGIYGRGDRRKL